MGVIKTECAYLRQSTLISFKMYKLRRLLMFATLFVAILEFVDPRPQESSTLRPTTTQIRKSSLVENANSNVRPAENTRSTTLGGRGTKISTKTPSIEGYVNDFEQQIDELVDGYFKGIAEIFKHSASAQTCAAAVADATNLVVEALKTL